MVVWGEENLREDVRASKAGGEILDVGEQGPVRNCTFVKSVIMYA